MSIRAAQQAGALGAQVDGIDLGGRGEGLGEG